MTGHFERGAWIEDAQAPKIGNRHTRDISDMVIKVRVEVDDHELRESIARMKVYNALKKRKPKAGWGLRLLAKIGIVSEMYDYGE